MLDRQTLGALLVVALLGCAGGRPAPAPPAPPPTIRLAVLVAESTRFPRAARAANASLGAARIEGVDETQVASVSLEVVQLSIECVEPTDDCYQAVGRTLGVNRVLFAQIGKGAKRRQPKVTVTLFDVDRKMTTRRAAKVFANERAAIKGVAALIGEATGP